MVHKKVFFYQESWLVMVNSFPSKAMCLTGAFIKNSYQSYLVEFLKPSRSIFSIYHKSSIRSHV